MLLRTPPLRLETKRVPIGPVRPNRNHPLIANCVGLWLFNGQSMGQDLMRLTPPLGFYNSAKIQTHIEGPALDTATSSNGGCSLSVVSGSPLYITSGHGLSTYCRWAPTATPPDQYATVVAMSYDSVSSPYAAQMIYREANTSQLYISWNYGGVFNSVGMTDIVSINTVKSQVVSHTFDTSFKFFSQGVEGYSNTTNTAAPTYGTTPIISIGRNGVNDRNSQAHIYIVAFFNRGLSLQESLLLETNPYSLVEPVNPLIYTPYVAPPAAKFRRRALGGGTQDLQYQPYEIRKT